MNLTIDSENKTIQVHQVENLRDCMSWINDNIVHSDEYTISVKPVTKIKYKEKPEPLFLNPPNKIPYTRIYCGDK